MDYLIVLIAAMNSLFNTLVQSFVPLLFAGLAAGWLLITYSSMRVMPREVFLRLHVPGLAAGWLMPLCAKGACFFRLKLFLILPFAGLAAGWPYLKWANSLLWPSHWPHSPTLTTSSTA